MNLMMKHYSKLIFEACNLVPRWRVDGALSKANHGGDRQFGSGSSFSHRLAVNVRGSQNTWSLQWTETLPLVDRYCHFGSGSATVRSSSANEKTIKIILISFNGHFFITDLLTTSDWFVGGKFSTHSLTANRDGTLELSPLSFSHHSVGMFDGKTMTIFPWYNVDNKWTISLKRYKRMG